MWPNFLIKIAIHPTVPHSASAMDYVTCRAMSLSERRLTLSARQLFFLGAQDRQLAGGMAEGRGCGPNAACILRQSAVELSALGKLVGPRSFAESRRRALAPKRRTMGDIEKQAAHQRHFGVRLASSSCRSVIPKTKASNENAWEGKLGQLRAQFGSGLQFNSTAKADRFARHHCDDDTRAKQ